MNEQNNQDKIMYYLVLLFVVRLWFGFVWLCYIWDIHIIILKRTFMASGILVNTV